LALFSFQGIVGDTVLKQEKLRKNMIWKCVRGISPSIF